MIFIAIIDQTLFFLLLDHKNIIPELSIMVNIVIYLLHVNISQPIIEYNLALSQLMTCMQTPPFLKSGQIGFLFHKVKQCSETYK